MKKITSFILATTIASMALLMTACGNGAETQSEKVETVKVTVLDEKSENVDIDVPFDPKKIVVLDHVAMDMLDSWGLGDRVVGYTKSSGIDYLQKYMDDENIKNLGSLKEVDLEGIMALEPDIIFSSGRTADLYKELSAIAPTVCSSIDYETGTLESFKSITLRNAKIFGKEAEAQSQLEAYNDRINAIKESSKDKTAVVGLVSSSNFSTLGNTSRCSIIGTDLGFNNIANDGNSTHGDASSFEFLVKLNADYIFVLDRDTAIGQSGSAIAKDVMDNELVHNTNAYKNDNIVYLTPSAWYMVEGGIQSFDIMLKDIEKALF